MEDIILLGLGGHAHSVVDSIEQTGKYRIIGFLEREEMQEKQYHNYKVLDIDKALKKYYDNGLRNAFITIGFLGYGVVRNRLYEQLKQIGYRIPNIIDKTASISSSVKLEEGIFIGKNVIINTDVEIGSMCIINTGAVVEHDCKIGSFSHIAVRSVLCGDVHVGAQTLIGANATIIQNIHIGRNVIVGAGTLIRKDIQDNTIQYGTIERQRGIDE